ncbi:diacylglycerol kinase family lipid kinase [soil metagenome]
MRIILNPMARHGAGARLRPRIEAELSARGIDFDIVETTRTGHAADLARDAAAQGVSTIVAAGGDGTVHEVVNGMMAARTPGVTLGVLPIGTGNDFVKLVPGTATITDACDTLAGGRSAPVDVGLVQWSGGTEYFVNAMGTGIDVEVVRRMRRVRFVPGGVLYVVALLRALAVYRPLQIRVRTGADTFEKSIMNLAVCNGPCIGGAFRICPDARHDDGLLDTCMIEEMPILRNARMVPRVVRGTHPGHVGVTMLRGTEVHLSLTDGRPLPFQVDGELREAADGAAGIHVSLAPDRLNVMRGTAVAA